MGNWRLQESYRMYEAFFKFRCRPFLATVETSRYYPATVIENARKTLVRAIERAEGPGLIVGPSGTGKSLLAQMLAEQLADQFSVALLSNGRLATRQALLQAILYELRLPYRGMDEGELRLLLVDHLEPDNSGRQGLLLIIDEAHTLPWRLLEEVRLITNLVRGGQPRARVVLAGSPLLEERFASPRMNSFSQRLAARCYLESLDSVETGDYVRAQISAVGGDPQLFLDEALKSVYRATDGIPRLVNQVCDHALLLASLGGVERMTSEVIDEAWSDLQQLPAPWNTTQKVAIGGPDVVEFGRLDDTDEAPEAIPFRAGASEQIAISGAEERLNVIEQQLSSLDDEFRPAGSIGESVDLDFPEFGDPFSENFAEEEVIIDRYRGDFEMFAKVPRVNSAEGKQIGAMLGPMPTTQPRDPDSAEPATQTAIALAGAAEPHGSQGTRQLATLAARSPQLAERLEALDNDIVIIEDEPAGPSWPAPPRVRRLEYGQLFARLRRG